MYIINIDYCYDASSVRTCTTYEKAKKMYDEAKENPEVTYCLVTDIDGHELMEYIVDLR